MDLDRECLRDRERDLESFRDHERRLRLRLLLLLRDQPEERDVDFLSLRSVETSFERLFERDRDLLRDRDLE